MPKVVTVAAATCGSVAVVAAFFAAIYAWHKLQGPMPLVAWAASLCAKPRGEGVAGLKGSLTSLKVPEDGIVQVMPQRPGLDP